MDRGISGVEPGKFIDQQSIYLTTVGLEERSRQVLANALNRHAAGLCILAEAQQAQVALLDLENSDAKNLFNDFQEKYPRIKVIGLGKQPSDLPVHAFISKPAILQQLLATIIEMSQPVNNQSMNKITNDKIARAMQALDNKNIAKSLHSRAEKSQPKTAAKRAMPGKNDEMSFDPGRFLLGSALSAANQSRTTNQTAVLTCWNDRTIFIDSHNDKVISNLTDNQIRNLAIVPLDDNLSSPIHTEYYPAGEVNRVLDAVLGGKDMRHFSQEVFLWNLGLLTCRGRIPANFTVCDPYYLRRWPNLTRMRIPDNAMRILSFWSQQPCSLADMKEQLDIPYQDIFSIVSAAYAAGLTGEARRKSDQIMQAVSPGEHSKRGLMNSIISRFRGNKTPDSHDPIRGNQ